MKRIVFAIVIMIGTVTIPRDVRALDCKLTVENSIGIEALCLYAERASLDGHTTDNPLRLRSMIDYATVHDPNAEQFFATGRLNEYFGPRIKMIHSCYVHRKINMCDVYRSD